MNMICRKYIVRGFVQGVGFRWFVKRTAQAFGVGGTVRNLFDGSVEIYAEAAPDELLQFESAIRRGPGRAQVQHLEKESSDRAFSGKFKIIG